MPAAPGCQRNFTQAPSRVIHAGKGGGGTGRRGGEAEKERERQRSPVSFPDTHKLPGSPYTARVWEEGGDVRILLCTVCHSVELSRKAENIETRHFPPQCGPVGGWALSGCSRVPARQRSRSQLVVVRTTRTWGWGRALVWAARTGPSLARSFHLPPPGNLLSREQPHSFWRRARRAAVLSG